MACLNLSNGNFISLQFSSSASFNAGDVTISRTPNQIVVQKSNLSGSLIMNGDFEYAVFGVENYIAILEKDDNSVGYLKWTVSVVNITGNNIASTLLFSISLPSSKPPPSFSQSPGSGSLLFIWSVDPTYDHQITKIMIVRSDNGDLVMGGPTIVSDINGPIGAEVTATQLIMNHPSGGGFNNDNTIGARPQGFLQISPPAQDFGEAVLDAADPTLATIARLFTLSNTGKDCLTINGVSDAPPYTLTPLSANQFPITLDPDESVDIDVEFTPTAIGNNITGLLIVDRLPAAGADSFPCSGDARLAEAKITASVSNINFGTIPHPDTDVRSFTVSNSGEKDLDVTISPSPPPGSDFTWTPDGLISLPFGGTPVQVNVTFRTPGDIAAQSRTINLNPSEGNSQTVNLSGAGCIAAPVMFVPGTTTLDFGDSADVMGGIEQGFRTVRFIEIRNDGDDDLTFDARITVAVDPSHVDLFGLVLPDNDITDAPLMRTYNVLPPTRCGSGAIGSNRVTVAVSFFADDVPSTTPYVANLEITNPITGAVSLFSLQAIITPPVPIDAVLVLDRSGSMSDMIGSRNKMEASLAAGHLFLQMLRDGTEDRAAIVRYNQNPNDLQSIIPVMGNRAMLETTFSAANFTPSGFTNLAGGVIVAEDEFNDPPHPSSPPGLKRTIIVLTDGKENRCYQEGGTWYSITGRDAPSMRRPNGAPQDSEPLPTPQGISIYGIGLGNPADIDGIALDQLSTATGGSYTAVVELFGQDYFLLEKYFTQIFMETAGMAMISDPFFTITLGEVHEHEFDIFPGDVKTMVVLYDYPGKRLPFLLVSPRGEEFSGTMLPPGFGVRYHSTRTSRFVEITFPKGEPERYAGRWKAIVLHEGGICRGDINLYKPNQDYKEVGGYGFIPLDCTKTEEAVQYGIAIGAGSNLRMQPYVEPGVKYVGDSLHLTAVLAEAGLPVTNATVHVNVKTPSGAHFTVLLRDDGMNFDGDANNGEYARTFTHTPSAGVYQLHFRAEGLQAGRPYVREAYRTKLVCDPRVPPDTGDGGNNKDCCKALLREIRRLNANLIKK